MCGRVGVRICVCAVWVCGCVGRVGVDAGVGVGMRAGCCLLSNFSKKISILFGGSFLEKVFLIPKVPKVQKGTVPQLLSWRSFYFLVFSF